MSKDKTIEEGAAELQAAVDQFHEARERIQTVWAEFRDQVFEVFGQLGPLLESMGIEPAPFVAGVTPIVPEPDARKPAALPTADLGFVCDVCGKSFKSGQAVGGHKSVAHRDGTKPKAKPKAKPSGSYRCDICDRTFASPGGLGGHNAGATHKKALKAAADERAVDPTARHQHLKTRGGRYQCPTCNLIFVTMGGIDRHFQDHPVHKPLDIS